jgi:hypothetical protein
MNIEYGYHVVRLLVLNTSGMALTWRDVPSQWRCLLKACLMFGFDDDNVQDQTGNHLVKYSEILSSTILLGGETLFWPSIGPAFPFRISE